MRKQRVRCVFHRQWFWCINHRPAKGLAPVSKFETKCRIAVALG